MTIDQKSVLEKNFDLAKKHIGIRENGTIDIIDKSSLNGPEQISLYLIGKLYALEAELVDSEYVSNKELMENLGIVEGSLYPWLKELRENGSITQKKDNSKTFHAISKNRVEKILEELGA